MTHLALAATLVIANQHHRIYKHLTIATSTGDCIAVTNSSDITIESSQIGPGGGNTAISVWNQYASVPCGPVRVVNDVATEIEADGSQSGFWDGGGCDPVTLTHDIWDAAAEKLLTPVDKKLPPPSIPPRPVHCTIETPYTNQTRWPACQRTPRAPISAAT